jgi:hypothetical protein
VSARGDFMLAQRHQYTQLQHANRLRLVETHKHACTRAISDRTKTTVLARIGGPSGLIRCRRLRLFPTLYAPGCLRCATPLPGQFAILCCPHPPSLTHHGGENGPAVHLFPGRQRVLQLHQAALDPKHNHHHVHSSEDAVVMMMMMIGG